jgi:hypothetical protein
MTAADIAPTGGVLEPGQLRRIHQLKDAIGGRYSGDGTDARDNWAKALRPFKKANGEPCAHSSELSKDQATFLIWRMENITERQAQRAEVETVVPDIAPKPTLHDLMARHMDDEEQNEWLHATFGKGHVQELDSAQCEAAFALLEAFGDPDKFDTVATRLRALDRIK